jgi:hypothetical protein
MNNAGQEERVLRMARRCGLRLVTSRKPAGYILVNRRNVVEFGVSRGYSRATLDEVEKYLIDRSTSYQR